jgi:hypothetical protein
MADNESAVSTWLRESCGHGLIQEAAAPLRRFPSQELSSRLVKVRMFDGAGKQRHPPTIRRLHSPMTDVSVPTPVLSRRAAADLDRMLIMASGGHCGPANHRLDCYLRLRAFSQGTETLNGDSALRSIQIGVDHDGAQLFE